jgi:hypothetical protein
MTWHHVNVVFATKILQIFHQTDIAMAAPLFGEAGFGLKFGMPQQNRPAQGAYARLAGENPYQLPSPVFQRHFRIASSVYSQSPNPNVSTVNGPSITPRASLRGLWAPRPTSNHGSRENLPQNYQLPDTTYSPASENNEWNAPEVVTDRVPLSGARSTEQLRSHEQPPLAQQPSETRPSTSATSRSRRKHQRRRRHHQHSAWVRDHRHGTSPVRSRNVLHDPRTAKNHGVSVIVATLFLAATVITCK